MPDFPECGRHRGSEDNRYEEGEESTLVWSGENGQICHRIYEHDGNCIFDREPEFEPPRPVARPLPKRSVWRMGR